MSVIIDREFRALIAPLQPEEREQLEANLVAHGCRDPLALWRGILIDGHNRHEICTRLKIPCRTVEVALPSREHVLIWIEQNQLGRRNITDWQRAGILQRLKKRLAAQALEEKRERMRTVGKLAGRGKKKTLAVAATDKVSKKDSRAALSKKHKVSERKIKLVDELEKKLGVEIVDKIVAGTVTPSEVKAELKRAEKQRLVAAIQAEAPKFPEGPFRVLVIDPPWKYEVRGEDSTHRAANPYPDMTLDEIKALPVAKLAHEDSILWLWTTNAFMRQAFDCLDAWGFQPKTMLTWVKDRMGTGDWLRGQTEHCLMAARGKPTHTLTNQTTALIAPLREHSRKPDEFYRLVEAVCPGNRLDWYARQKREGWEAFGAESEKFANVS